MKLLRLFLITLFIGVIGLFLVWPEHPPPEEKSVLHIFTWGNCIDLKAVDLFYKQTGIQVKLSYYASNEELMTKLCATKGVGYDLIVPSDYAVKILIDRGLLQRLDHTKLAPHYAKIDPFLLGHAYDPENLYSLPYQYDVSGFGVDKAFFEQNHLKPSWDLIFNPPPLPFKVGVSCDPIEEFNQASFYLFGKLSPISPQEKEAIEALLIAQKAWVEAYIAFRADYLLATKSVPIAFAQDCYIIGPATANPDKIDFVLPDKGTFISIENFCIPQPSKKQDLAYQFLDFLYQQEIMEMCANDLAFFPAFVIDHFLYQRYFDQVRKTFAQKNYQLLFYQQSLPEEEIRRLWIHMKSTR